MSPCSDSLSLRLPYSVKLAIERKSLTHYAKGTQSPLRAPTVCMYAVSGSISLPSRGSFHLSLTVLCAIGRQVVFSLGGWSPLLPTKFLVLRGTLDLGLSALPFVYGAFTLSRLPFQVIQLGLTSILPVLNPEKPELLGLGSALFARRYCGHLV